MEQSTELSEQKEVKAGESVKVTPHFCPICGVDSIQATCMIEEDGGKALWFSCNCGVVFQEKFPTGKEIYNENYIIGLSEAKDSADRYNYLVKTYASLIEELIYGRMMLEVGFCVPTLLNTMKDRGWLTWGIDINPTLAGGNIYKGDFLEYDFSLKGEDVKKITGEDRIQRQFDLIWMGHVLEHMENPIAALQKAYDLLDHKGVIFIATPDIDFFQHHTPQGWPHFKMKEHYIMWSERALCRELERIGFNIILKRRNFSSRYMSWFDLHIIAQKRYF